MLCKQLDEFRLQKDATFDQEENALTLCAEWTTEGNFLISERIYNCIDGYRYRITLAFTMTGPSSAYQICRTLQAGQEKPMVTNKMCARPRWVVISFDMVHQAYLLPCRWRSCEKPVDRPSLPPRPTPLFPQSCRFGVCCE